MNKKFLGAPSDHIISVIDKRINGKILAETTSACYTVCNSKGATMPEERTPQNLSSCIQSIHATKQISDIDGSYIFNDPDNTYRIQSVSDNAFYNKTYSLGFFSGNKVCLPEAVTIGINAFNKCLKITTVDLPIVNELKKASFFNCVNLSNLNVPFAETIGNDVFKNCSSIVSIILPSVKTVGANAFEGCASLLSVQLPLAQSIGWAAFYNTNQNLSIDLSQNSNYSVTKDSIYRTNWSVPATATILYIDQH